MRRRTRKEGRFSPVHLVHPILSAACSKASESAPEKRVFRTLKKRCPSLVRTTKQYPKKSHANGISHRFPDTECAGRSVRSAVRRSLQNQYRKIPYYNSASDILDEELRDVGKAWRRQCMVNTYSYIMLSKYRNTPTKFQQSLKYVITFVRT